MRRFIVGGLLAIVTLMWLMGTASAQLGVGIEVPPLFPPKIFAAYGVSETLRVWLGVIPVPQETGGLLLEFDAAVKYAFGPVHVREIRLTPWVGAGLVFAPLFSGIFVEPYGQAGAEYNLPGTPVSFYGTLDVGVFILPGAPVNLEIGGVIGARYDF